MTHQCERENRAASIKKLPGDALPAAGPIVRAAPLPGTTTELHAHTGARLEKATASAIAPREDLSHFIIGKVPASQGRDLQNYT